MNLELISKSPPTNGRPTPLLFVHGAWHGAWCWDEHFLDHFANHGYHVHALSLREHGNSEKHGRLRWTRIADYVADVAQVAAQLPTPPAIIAHSMGGAVAQKYLETHHAPAAVLLASVPPAGVLATTLRILRRHPLPFLKMNLKLSLAPLIATPELVRSNFFSADMPEELVRRYGAKMQDESYRAFLDMMIFNRPRPQRVKTAMLVLGGTNDTVFLPYEVEATGRAYNVQATIFPNTAHDMMLESTWQATADHILGWLDGKLPVAN
jgi:pimeloyl-ACP methyl ester carboxylesterase